MKQNLGSYAPYQPDQSMNSNMRMHVSKLNMLENHLITIQWCGPLTGTRETTSNDNCSQGTIVQSVNVKMKLKTNTFGIIQLKANDENLSSDVKNLPLRLASSKVLKGIL